MSRGAERTPSTCPVCAASGGRVEVEDPVDYEYGVEVDARIERCDHCGSLHLEPRPAASQLASWYPDDYHAYHDDHGVLARTLVRLRSRRRARTYARLASTRPIRLFDVGTGDCRHFDALRAELDVECAGVELQVALAEAARRRGYDVFAGTLEELDVGDRASSFDIVSMYHLLEHVIDPQVVLDKAFELLRPGGHLLAQLPCADSWERRLFGRWWGGHHFPRHLQSFSRDGLELCLRRAGFEDVRVRTAPHLQTGLSVQNVLVGHGWRPRMRHGKTPVYGALLLAVAPFELAAFVADRGGIVDVSARKPR
jgi:SAM-dependent methyltransferase